MRHIFHNQARRRGAVVPLFALLVVPLMGMLAFSIDLGYIALVATDLQTAADSAALLASGNRSEPLSSEMPARWRISTLTASIVTARQFKLDAKFSIAIHSFRKTFIV